MRRKKRIGRKKRIRIWGCRKTRGRGRRGGGRRRREEGRGRDRETRLNDELVANSYGAWHGRAMSEREYFIPVMRCLRVGCAGVCGKGRVRGREGEGRGSRRCEWERRGA